jgi:hypothetical protein
MQIHHAFYRLAVESFDFERTTLTELAVYLQMTESIYNTAVSIMSILVHQFLQLVRYDFIQVRWNQ